MAAAERFWAAVVGVDLRAFVRATLKRHNPKTIKAERRDGLSRVSRSSDVTEAPSLYRRIEGAWYGIV